MLTSVKKKLKLKLFNGKGKYELMCARMLVLPSPSVTRLLYPALYLQFVDSQQEQKSH